MTNWSDADFDAFVGARMGALVRFAYALTGDLGHAEDLVQTALLRVYRRRTAPEDAERYVRKAIVNANLSRFRRRRVRESLVGHLPDQPGAPDPGSPAEQGAALLRLLAELSPRQRAVLALRYGADLSEAETAELLGVTTGTVKTLASRCTRQAARRPGSDGLRGECPMNDEELRQALGTALAPPPLQAVPDAGVRLRSRAARQRRERALAGGSVVAVLGVLLASGSCGPRARPVQHADGGSGGRLQPADHADDHQPGAVPRPHPGRAPPTRSCAAGRRRWSSTRSSR